MRVGKKGERRCVSTTCNRLLLCRGEARALELFAGDASGVIVAQFATLEERFACGVSRNAARRFQCEQRGNRCREQVRDLRHAQPGLSLALRPAEVVFVVGGNGSGKTTLAKLLVGLYEPEDGDVVLDGKVVSQAERESYRQLFSAVFSDFHIFDAALGLDADDGDARASELLEALALSHKVRIDSGVFSTTKLSTGQQKRLALLIACLEDRPICVFDEWAKDQDPSYKDVFYTEILPSLRARGKCVLVITHDDRYFHLADRCLKLEYGRLLGEDDATADAQGAPLPHAIFLGHAGP